MKYIRRIFYSLFCLTSCSCLLLEAQPVKDDNTYYQDYKNRAEQYLRIPRYDSALLYFDSAYDVAKRLNDPSLYIRMESRRAYSYWKLNQNEKALNILRQSRTEAYGLRNDTLKAILDNSMGLVLSKIEPDSALVYYRKALTNYQKLSDTIGMGSAWMNISILHKNLDENEMAIETGLNSYWLLRKTDNPKMLISTLITLGNAYNNIKKYDSALACYEKSYEISVENQFSNLANIANNNMAVIYYSLNDFEKARDKNLLSIAYYEELNDEGQLARLYSNISLTYRYLKDFEQAIYYGRKGVQFADRIGDYKQEMDGLINLGIAYKGAKRYNEAESCYKQSLAMALETERLEPIRKAYYNLSSLYFDAGRYKESVENFRLHDSIKDMEKTEEIAEALAEAQTKYEVLSLKEQQQITELRRARTRTQLNATLIIGFLAVAILIAILLFLRYRMRKNRIISNQRIQQLENEKKILAAQSVIVGQEEERKRIAQELHDGIGILLSTARIQFSSIESDAQDTEASETFRKARQMLDKAGKEVRRISHDMMPGLLTKFGLMEAIEGLFEDVRDLSKLEIELTINCPEERYPEDMEIMLYRVVQEMVNNTIKHAEADNISFTMNCKEEILEIDYTDDGKGFDESTLPEKKSLGLDGIRSRIDYLRGSVEINSSKGNGTHIRIAVPILKNKDQN